MELDQYDDSGDQFDICQFFRVCAKNLGAETLGHLFIDEAGQALPQAAVGAIYRSRHVMAVGDPLQIPPVLTLDSNTLYMLSRHFKVTEKYLSASASVQTLTDAASQYGFYRKEDRSEDSWVGIPLWVHRRCRYPMFTISNVISYEKLMVQGVESYGKTGWFDVGGTADNKYVEAQGEFLLQKLREMIDKNPKITDRNEKDVIYVITPFPMWHISFHGNCGKFILPDMMSKGNRPMSELSIPFRGKRLRLFFLYSAPTGRAAARHAGR